MKSANQIMSDPKLIGIEFCEYVNTSTGPLSKVILCDAAIH